MKNLGLMGMKPMMKPMRLPTKKRMARHPQTLQKVMTKIRRTY